MAAAAWSWVEKMLHEAQRTCAPSACSVSISTRSGSSCAGEPVMRAPFSGWVREFLADRHQAGHLGLGDADCPYAKETGAAAPLPSFPPDAGKTTLTEKLLLFSGAIQIAGSVKARKGQPPRHQRLDGDRSSAASRWPPA